MGRAETESRVQMCHVHRWAFAAVVSLWKSRPCNLDIDPCPMDLSLFHRDDPEATLT